MPADGTIVGLEPETSTLQYAMSRIRSCTDVGFHAHARTNADMEAGSFERAHASRHVGD